VDLFNNPVGFWIKMLEKIVKNPGFCQIQEGCSKKLKFWNSLRCIISYIQRGYSF
jgi:hypothetical protein